MLEIGYVLNPLALEVTGNGICNSEPSEKADCLN